MAANGSTPPLSIESINPKVVKADYAVRGEIVRSAQLIAKDLQANPGKHPFDKVIWCNIGNPQLLGQKPVTYFRQVLSLCEYPKLLDHPAVHDIFPSDVITRARALLADIPGGLGAYSESPGAMCIRRMVADAISRRDGGIPCDPEGIYMTDGASPGVHYIMEMLIRSPKDAFMVPIPQYPLYSATLTLYGGTLVPYELDEATGWSLDVAQMAAALAAAREKGLLVRGLVVINPGNPTGQCLSRQNMEDVLSFCAREGLVLVADEVYQANIYAADKSWVSFKRAAHDMGLSSTLPLVSLHSTSKGFVGECGRRGGYMEVTGFPQEVHEQILKLASVNLCPNVSGQITCALMMNPPAKGEPSYEQYHKEKHDIIDSLRRRSQTLVQGLNKLEGVSCQDAEGALYAFPQIRLPPAAAAAAAALGKQPDWLYCKELLEATGVVVVPGSGFGQADGTHHFRTTFLPAEQDIAGLVAKLTAFHATFMSKYGGGGGSDAAAAAANGNHH